MERYVNPEINQDMPHFTIQGTLPTMNEYLASEARHPQAGAKMKRDNLQIVSTYLRRDLKRWKTDKPLIIHYRFFEPNKKRDKDNIAFMVLKTVHDAMQKCGVITNDGWANIENFTFDFFVDSINPRIEVYLEEINE